MKSSAELPEDSLSSRNIVVTGAAGLIGRAVTSHLRALGATVTSIARQQSNDIPSQLKLMDLVRQPLEMAIKERPDAIIHLAAAVPHSARYPDNADSAKQTRTIDTNVRDAAMAWQCPVVYMSTCGLYDRLNQDIKFEDDDTNISLISPYFEAKKHGEALFTDCDQSTILRLSAPIGPGIQSTLVVSRFLHMAETNQAISLWGSGNREQNFIDARDVAELIATTVLWPQPGVYNLAAIEPVTMKELAQEVISVCGKGSVTFSGTPDPLDSETARYSTEKIRNTFNWAPRFSLRESLQSIRSTHV